MYIYLIKRLKSTRKQDFRNKTDPNSRELIFPRALRVQRRKTRQVGPTIIFLGKTVDATSLFGNKQIRLSIFFQGYMSGRMWSVPESGIRMNRNISSFCLSKLSKHCSWFGLLFLRPALNVLPQRASVISGCSGGWWCSLG